MVARIGDQDQVARIHGQLTVTRPASAATTEPGNRLLSPMNVAVNAVAGCRYSRSAEIAIVENLTGLEQVDWADPVLSVLPLKLRDADGAPCRAVMLELG